MTLAFVAGAENKPNHPSQRWSNMRLRHCTGLTQGHTKSFANFSGNCKKTLLTSMIFAQCSAVELIVNFLHNCQTIFYSVGLFVRYIFAVLRGRVALVGLSLIFCVPSTSEKKYCNWKIFINFQWFLLQKCTM